MNGHTINIIRMMLEPMPQIKSYQIQNGKPINNFSIPYHISPIVDQCVLPGGRYYLSIKSPPRDTLNDGNKAKMARWLFTLKDETISKIHINPFGMIDQMMFLSP